MVRRAGERLEQFGGDDDVLWAHHIDAIGQRHPGEVGIDERNHAADPRDADPRGQKLRPARHHQTDRVALAKILRERPARIAVRARRKLPVREAFAVRQQRRGVAVFVRKLEDDLRKDPGWVPGDRGCQLERAHGALDGRHLCSQPIDETHYSSSAGRRARRRARRAKHRAGVAR